MAIWRRGSPHALFIARTRAANIRASSSGPDGRSRNRLLDEPIRKQRGDGALLSSLKTERFARKVYRSRDAARADVFDYIERFYNTVRRHLTIGYLSPVEFERKVGFA